MKEKKQKQIAREKLVKTEKEVLWFFHMFILLDDTTREGVNETKQNDSLHTVAQL